MKFEKRVGLLQGAGLCAGMCSHAGNLPSCSPTQWFRFGIYELKVEIKEE